MLEHASPNSPGVARRRREPAEFPLHQLGKGDRRAVLEIGADDLHPDRQAGVGAVDRRRRRRQARGRGDSGPDQLVLVGILVAVDLR